jgi:hypothetical protein
MATTFPTSMAELMVMRGLPERSVLCADDLHLVVDGSKIDE